MNIKKEHVCFRGDTKEILYTDSVPVVRAELTGTFIPIDGIQPYQVKESKNAAKLFYDFAKVNNHPINYLEHCVALYLGGQNNVLGICLLSIGGQSSALVSTPVIFSVALSMGARAFLLSHNHPSNRLAPSNTDKVLTKNLVKASKLMDISFLDHIIIGNGTTSDYYSFADNGDFV